MDEHMTGRVNESGIKEDRKRSEILRRVKVEGIKQNAAGTTELHFKDISFYFFCGS